MGHLVLPVVVQIAENLLIDGLSVMESDYRTTRIDAVVNAILEDFVNLPGDIVG